MLDFTSRSKCPNSVKNDFSTLGCLVGSHLPNPFISCHKVITVWQPVRQLLLKSSSLKEFFMLGSQDPTLTVMSGLRFKCSLYYFTKKIVMALKTGIIFFEQIIHFFFWFWGEIDLRWVAETEPMLRKQVLPRPTKATDISCFKILLLKCLYKYLTVHVFY